MANQIAYEALTVSTTALGPTAATVTPRVRSALFYIKGAAVRWRADGTAPTATAGAPIEDGGNLPLVGEGTIRNIQFIRRDGVNATVHCVYFDEPLDAPRAFSPGSVEGTVAHDAVDSGNPVKIGGIAETTAPTAVADGDRVNANFDEFGSLRTVLVDPADGTDLTVPDDAAWTIGNPVVPIGALADETSPDLVNEGDIGVPRMTLDRQLRVQIEGGKASYSIGTTGLVPAASPTDIFEVYGSATKTIRVRRISYTANAASAQLNDVILIKRSTANTGGTSTSRTPVPHDSNSAAATATVKDYTANPTVGTAVGTIRAVRNMSTAAAAVDVDRLEWLFGELGDEGIVLRGTGEGVCLNLNGGTAPSAVDYHLEFTEE